MSRVAVITGASAGVGRATAVAFAGAGFDVAVLARGAAGLEAAAKDVAAQGARSLAVPVDVSDWNQVDAAADQVEQELGPIDVWVNNAMTTVFSWIRDMEPDEFRRATEVTYLGQVHGTMAALRRMRARDAGTIVNVGSALAFVGIPLQAAYCGAKFACRGFFESTRAELLAEGSQVRLSMVHLPAVNTPQFEWCCNKLPQHPQPVPPIYQPEVAARHILAAAVHPRRAKVLGAWNKVVVAGARLVPSVVERYAARTAISGQQTGEPASPGRPANLYHPVDRDEDYGPRGRFGDRAGGSDDPSFLRSLPQTLSQLAAAAGDTATSKLSRWAYRRRAERSPG